MHNDKVTVKLQGGVGNQLFIYFAGLALATKRSLPLVIDISLLKLGLTVHESDIYRLDLDLNEKIEKPLGTIGALRHRIWNKLMRISLSLKWLDEKIFLNYRSKKVGYDEKIWNLPGGSTLFGYYQSWKYFDFVKKKGLVNSVLPRTPSIWFQNSLAEISGQNPIAIHVRRGDYEKVADKFGLLSKVYYLDALKKVRDGGFTGPIWVFSDDIRLAKSLLNEGEFISAKFIEQSEDSSPEESLILMSMAKVIVIANSTYSWWAASLNMEKNLVIAPKTWFKSMEAPEYLLPDSWMKVESAWV
jgi:hypothetical protein